MKQLELDFGNAVEENSQLRATLNRLLYAMHDAAEACRLLGKDERFTPLPIAEGLERAISEVER